MPGPMIAAYQAAKAAFEAVSDAGVKVPLLRMGKPLVV